LDFNRHRPSFIDSVELSKSLWRRHRSYLHGWQTGRLAEYAAIHWDVPKLTREPASSRSQGRRRWHLPSQARSAAYQNTSFPSDQAPAIRASSFRLASPNLGIGKTRSGVGGRPRGKKGVSSSGRGAIKRNKVQKFFALPQSSRVVLRPIRKKLSNIPTNSRRGRENSQHYTCQLINPLES